MTESTPELLTQTLNRIAGAILVVDASTGKIVDVNETTTELHGYSRQELIGMSPSDVSETFPDTTQWQAHVAEVQKKDNLTIYTHHIRKDGSTFPARVDVNYVEVEGGEFIVAIVRDATEERRRNPALYKSESRYSSVFENAPHALWEEDFSKVKEMLDDLRNQGITDIDTYLKDHPGFLEDCLNSIRIIDVNRRALELYGAEDVEALRDHFKKTTTLEYIDEFREQIVALDQGMEEFGQTRETKTITGEIINVQVKIVVPPGHHDDLGQVFVSVEDITEQVETREALEESERRYRSMFENSAVGVATAELDGNIRQVNPSFASMLGYDIETVESSHVEDFVHEDNEDQCELRIPELINGKVDQLTFPTRYVTADRDVIWVSQSNTLVRDESGEPDYLLFIARDITEKKQTREKLEQIIENSPVAMANVDEQGRTVDWNPAAEELFGWNREEVIGEPLPNLPSGREQEHEELRKRVFSGETVRGLETKRQHKDGTEIPVLLSAAPYIVEGGEAMGGIGMYVDVSEQREIRHQLEARERLLRTLVSNVPGIVYRCQMDSDWTMEFVSDNVERVTGYPPEDFIGNAERSFAEVIHPDDRQPVEEAVREAVKNEEQFEVEYRLRRKDGEVRWMFERGRAVFDEAGEVEFLHGVILDITERKRTQEQLQERTRWLDSLVSSIPGTVYREKLAENYDEWTMKFISDPVEELTGVSVDEFVEQDRVSLNELVHDEDRSRVVETIERAVEAGEFFEIEYRLVRPDGEVRWVLERGNAVELPEEEPRHIHGVIIDITERKRAQKQLEKSEQLFRSTFEQAAVGIAHVSPDGSFLRFNDKLCSLLGYDRQELREKTFQEITHPDDLEQDLDHVESLLEGEHDQYAMEKRYFRKDGSVLWAQLTVGIVRTGADVPQYFVSVIQDITARKQAQQELRASEQSLEKFYEITIDPEVPFGEKVHDLLRLGIKRLGVDAGFVTRIEGTGLQIKYEEGGGGMMSEGATVDLDKTFCRATVESDGFQSIENAMEEGFEDDLGEEFPYRGYRGAQIFVEGELYGTLCFESREPMDDPPTDAEESFVRLMAQWLGREIQRRQTESELRESEQMFRELAENIEGVFWLVDPEQKQVLYVSPAYERIWGLPREELYADWETLKKPVHPDDRERVDEALPVEKDTDYRIEYRIKQPDGEIRWILDRAFPVHNEQGEVVRVAGIAEDITERKELREERDQFFNLSLDLVCVADMDGHFVDINPAFSEVLGYDRETLMSKPFLEFVHPEDREKTREVMGRLREGEDLNNFENRYITADGEICWLQWVATSQGDRIYSVSRDITKQRQYRDQLEEALAEKQVLLEEVHHRVKNNLQVISSLLDMQARKFEDPQALQAFRDSVSRIRSMALIHEKLYQSDTLDQVNLQTYLRELGTKLVESRATRPQTINFEIDETDLTLDESIPLGMIVNELVSNAIEHGFDAGESGEILVQFESEEATGRLTVRDYGRGLPEDYDVEESSSMGMKIVRTLVQHELEGDIDFREDGGLIVTVEFPV